MLVSASATFALWLRSVQVRVLTAVFALLICLSAQPLLATQTDIVGPAGSGSFGQTVTVLPNGNIVVTDPGFDALGPISNVGAVYLYDGATLALISTLTGSTANDNVGSGGVVVLANGNYVIRSPDWDNGAATNGGAVTFGSATTGVSGTVSSINSLVGFTANDSLGSSGITALTNGNYVVSSPNWDIGLISNAGAVTWCNGTVGTVGPAFPGNSLVGSTANNLIGSGGVTALSNGNYVVRSPLWDDGATTNVGAVTWGSGTGGTVGIISSTNSLVGSTSDDRVGDPGVTALPNGNYVVRSNTWNNGAIVDVGAVTWGSGTGGTVGVVSATNSLVGSTLNDQVGSTGVTALTNGNYVVSSQNWDNGAASNAGAVTWGSGTVGTVGAVSSANSLVGSTTNDVVSTVTALTNGNYVVSSSFWDNGATTNVGAVTWGNGTGGTVGVVSVANSLVGSTSEDSVASGGVTALTNGNYVVGSPTWDSGALVNVGAATWGNGATGTTGTISNVNSLVGSTAFDSVGNGVTALTNGNYVVRSTNWNNGATANVGAVTFGNGLTGVSGAVTAANSLVGSTADDIVGTGLIVALTNGNYVVGSPFWDNGAIVDAGAATWGNGATGTTGVVSAANSLVGSTAFDNVSSALALTNGNYVVISSNWDNGAIANTGAVTWCNGATGRIGVVSAANSLVGSTASDFIGTSVTVLTNGNYVVRSQSWDNGAVSDAGAYTFAGSGTAGAITSGAGGGNSVVGTVIAGTNTSAFDATRNRLFVGRSLSNTVSVLSFTTTAIANGDINNAANWSAGVPNGLLTGIIPTGRSMTISSVVQAGQIQVQCGGNLTGGSATAYIVGSVRRDFCSATGATFVYPIGDPSNYSPLTVSNVNGTGSLTASVSDDWLIGLQKTTSASRYWSLTGAGITADLAFTYTNGDVNGSESNYRVSRRNAQSGINTPILSNPNPSTNTVTAAGISSFSDWGVGNNGSVAPTAAGVSVSGRIMTSDGSGLRNAIVTLTGSDGVTRTARSSAFGYYSFDDVTAGETYVMEVVSKRYIFATRVLTVTDQLTDIDFVADGSLFSR